MTYQKKGHKKFKEQKIQYLDEICKNEELVDKWQLNRRKIVGIDPGKIDLISCSDGNKKDSKTFRYTQLQRAKEIQTKRNIILIMYFESLDFKFIKIRENLKQK